MCEVEKMMTSSRNDLRRDVAETHIAHAHMSCNKIKIINFI